MQGQDQDGSPPLLMANGLGFTMNRPLCSFHGMFGITDADDGLYYYVLKYGLLVQ